MGFEPTRLSRVQGERRTRHSLFQRIVRLGTSTPSCRTVTAVGHLAISSGDRTRTCDPDLMRVVRCLFSTPHEYPYQDSNLGFTLRRRVLFQLSYRDIGAGARNRTRSSSFGGCVVAMTLTHLGGSRRIRTLGEFPHSRFQGGCNRPLCHTSLRSDRDSNPGRLSPYRFSKPAH